jgi:hypothetical protein
MDIILLQGKYASLSQCNACLTFRSLQYTPCIVVLRLIKTKYYMILLMISVLLHITTTKKQHTQYTCEVVHTEPKVNK